MKGIKYNSNCKNKNLLTLFGADGGAAETANASDTTAEQSGAQAEPSGDAERRARFDSLIKGEFKDLFDERVKSAVMRRFRSEGRQPDADDEPRRIAEGWIGEEEAVKKLYPSFDLRKAATDPETGRRFMALLSAGFSVKDAYEALNKDEILNGMMRYAAERVREKTLNDIRSRGLRPSENGTSAGAVKLTSRSPESWTAEEMERVAQRVKRGERIVL